MSVRNKALVWWSDGSYVPKFARWRDWWYSCGRRIAKGIRQRRSRHRNREVRRSNRSIRLFRIPPITDVFYIRLVVFFVSPPANYSVYFFRSPSNWSVVSVLCRPSTRTARVALAASSFRPCLVSVVRAMRLYRLEVTLRPPRGRNWCCDSIPIVRLLVTRLSLRLAGPAMMY